MKKTAILTIILGLCVSAVPALAINPYGEKPDLPKPQKQLIPTVNIAQAASWEGEDRPTAPAGFKVTALARDLKHPRWLYVLPNGDILVAETDAPKKPDDSRGIKGFVQKQVMKMAGSGLGSANQITLLRDANGDGVAEVRSVFLSGLNSPFGMALIGQTLYIANTDAIVKIAYAKGATSLRGPVTKVANLPGGTLNHHWTKSLIASPDGQFLYIGIGSNSNIAENGMDKEQGRAQIAAYDITTGQLRPFATGLRNPVGLSFEPQTKVLWTAVNERDELGDNLVPDYMTGVKEGAFYGWPYSYYGQNIDTRVKPQNPGLVAKALKPDYALGNHTASLGLTFYTGKSYPAAYQGGAFIGQHGSWNRSVRSGYKVVFVPFTDGRPSGQPLDFLTGFLSDDGKAKGRPVGVAVDATGALLVADDVGDIVWRVSP
jgi:glucose/arabinose dehydrogenase